jgi:hypothetical protein
MTLAVPPIEVTDHCQPLRIGCPDGEIGTLCTSRSHRVSPQSLIQAEVAPLVEEKDIVLG